MVFILVFGLLWFGLSLSNARIRSEVAKGSGKFLSNVCNIVETTPSRFRGRSKSLAILAVLADEGVTTVEIDDGRPSSK